MENSHLISQIQNLLDEYVKIERWIGVSMESDEWEELIWEKSEELLKLLTQNQITENIIKKSINNRKGRKNVILFLQVPYMKEKSIKIIRGLYNLSKNLCYQKMKMKDTMLSRNYDLKKWQM